MITGLVNVVSIITSLFALYFGIHSYRNAKFTVIKDFFDQGDSPEQKGYRELVYSIYNVTDDSETINSKLLAISNTVARIVSFYDFWSLMVDKKHLPKWVFEGMPGKTAVNIFNKLKPYINYRRKTDNEYAQRFEKLIDIITKQKIQSKVTV